MNLASMTRGVAAVSGLFIAAAIAVRVDPREYEGGRYRDEEQRMRRNTSAIALMLGEFRTGLSDMMFMKADRYIHAGVSYVPHHPVMSAHEMAEEVHEHQDELGLHDFCEKSSVCSAPSGTPTLIPPPNKDFRGVVGHLHRQVQPWRDPHKPHVHTDGRELLPWFRVMTLSDPGYIRGYVTGSFWLQFDDIDRALEFINEGLQHNPDDFQLYVSRAILRTRQSRQVGDPAIQPLTPQVRHYLELAREDYLRAAELMLKVRPAEVDEAGFGPGGWSRYHDADAMAATGMAVTLTRLLGDKALAARLAQRYIQLFPDLPSLHAALTDDL